MQNLNYWDELKSLNKMYEKKNTYMIDIHTTILNKNNIDFVIFWSSFAT